MDVEVSGVIVLIIEHHTGDLQQTNIKNGVNVIFNYCICITIYAVRYAVC